MVVTFPVVHLVGPPACPLETYMCCLSSISLKCLPANSSSDWHPVLSASEVWANHVVASCPEKRR